MERSRGLAARVLAGQGAGDRLGQDQQHQVAVRLDLGPLLRGERGGQRAWRQAPVVAARREDLHGLAGDVADLLQGSLAAEGEGRGIPVQSPGRRSLVSRADQRLGEQRRVAVEHQQLVAERAEAGEPLQVRRPGRVLVQPALDVAQLVLDAADEVGEPRLGLQLELRQERGERRFGFARVAERPLPMAEVDPVHGLQPRRGEPLVPAAGLLARVGAVAFGRHRQPDRGDQHESHECGPRRPPPRPLQGALPGGRRPGADRLAGQEPPQVVGQLLGRGVAPRRLLGEALQADRLQVARDPRLEPRRRHHLLVDDLPEGLHDRRGLEGGPAGEHLVEDRSQRVDVGRRADLAGQPLRLLGGHVAGRPHHLAADGLAVLDLQPLGQAEVGDLRRAVGVEQDVGRLQVAVDDPDAVDRADGAGERGHQLGGLAGRHRRAGQPLGERAPLEHLEREVRHAADLAHLVDLDDVGMLHPGDDLGLDAESPELLGVDVEVAPDHLEGDRSLERPLEGLVDDPHAATAEQPKDFVAGD